MLRTDPTIRQTTRISPETTTGNLNLLLGSAGIKVNPVGRLLLMVNVLFALGDSGLQDRSRRCSGSTTASSSSGWRGDVGCRRSDRLAPRQLPTGTWRCARPLVLMRACISHRLGVPLFVRSPTHRPGDDAEQRVRSAAGRAAEPPTPAGERSAASPRWRRS